MNLLIAAVLTGTIGFYTLSFLMARDKATPHHAVAVRLATDICVLILIAAVLGLRITTGN